MKISDLIKPEDLGQAIVDKMVKVQLHPSAPLAIANYTQVAQFNQEKWNYVTDLCRGLIWNTNTYELVARPFAKFWNYNDPSHPETLPENLPATEPELTRKEDGSLGIIYRNPVNGRWEVATRGSFTSEQAMWATQYISDKQTWPLDVTPLVEIIYPENRIVIDYKGWSGLRLLAGVIREDGDEVPRSILERMAQYNGIDLVPLFNKSINEATSEDSDNEEGYVATWHRRGQPPLRVKIKFSTYKKLHRVITGTNAIAIWELLREGKSTDEILNHVPDEFKQWVRGIESDLLSKFIDIQQDANHLFLFAPNGSRKDFAEYAKTTAYPHLLFSLYDGKDVRDSIWKMIRPSGDVRPFKSEED